MGWPHDADAPEWGWGPNGDMNRDDFIGSAYDPECKRGEYGSSGERSEDDRSSVAITERRSTTELYGEVRISR